MKKKKLLAKKNKNMTHGMIFNGQTQIKSL